MQNRVLTLVFCFATIGCTSENQLLSAIDPEQRETITVRAIDPEHPEAIIEPAIVTDQSETIGESANNEISSSQDVNEQAVNFNPQGLSAGPGSNFVVLDDPKIVTAEAATWLDPQAMVLGVEYGGEARAYPLAQMAYHHIVNDQIAGLPYLVTY